MVDSALHSAKNLQIRWLTRVPETVGEARRLLVETARREMTEVEEGYAYREYEVTYSGVKQRWLVVYSPRVTRREECTLQRRGEKEAVVAQKA